VNESEKEKDWIMVESRKHQQKKKAGGERVRGTKGGTVLLLRYLRKAEDAKGSKGQEKEVIYY